MQLIMMEQIIERRLYRTETANLIASDVWWDGHNNERHGRNTFLLKTPKGSFFLQRQSQWQGEQDTIEPIPAEEAKDWYEKLPAKEVSYKEAFGEEPEEA